MSCAPTGSAGAPVSVTHTNVVATGSVAAVNWERAEDIAWLTQAEAWTRSVPEFIEEMERAEENRNAEGESDQKHRFNSPTNVILTSHMYLGSGLLNRFAEILGRPTNQSFLTSSRVRDAAIAEFSKLATDEYAEKSMKEEYSYFYQPLAKAALDAVPILFKDVWSEYSQQSETTKAALLAINILIPEIRDIVVLYACDYKASFTVIALTNAIFERIPLTIEETTDLAVEHFQSTHANADVSERRVIIRKNVKSAYQRFFMDCSCFGKGTLNGMKKVIRDLKKQIKDKNKKRVQSAPTAVGNVVRAIPVGSTATAAVASNTAPATAVAVPNRRGIHLSREVLEELAKESNDPIFMHRPTPSYLRDCVNVSLVFYNADNEPTFTTGLRRCCIDAL
jgi:hypothetical protein